VKKIIVNGTEIDGTIIPLDIMLENNDVTVLM
jgi:hypothetical protein